MKQGGSGSSVSQTKALKVALVFFFNHRFDGNFSPLKGIYGARFSTVRFIVPFYTGSDDDVIPVYENSLNFSGFFSQAFNDLAHLNAQHLLFVADDAFLHPDLDENNFDDFFRPAQNWGYISKLDWFDKEQTFWGQTRQAMAWAPASASGVEIGDELPSPDEADVLLARHGFSSRKINLRRLTPNPFHLPTSLRGIPRALFLAFSGLTTIVRLVFQPGPRLKLNYPLVGGYSDVFAISSNLLPEFSRLCGIFAAARLHSEIAVPTALCLACNTITQDQKLSFCGEIIWPDQNGHLGRLDDLGFSLRALQSTWPSNSLFVHPIKLSKWTS